MAGMDQDRLEKARLKGMLTTLQEKDSDIDDIVAYSQFVVAYLVQQDGANPGWRKANIDGPVYLVRRRVNPRYQLLVKNQFNTSDLCDNLHPDWELDSQSNYVFYKVKDPAKRIRGLWFHHDQERKRIEIALNRVLEELRSQPMAQQPLPPLPDPSPIPEGNNYNYGGPMVPSAGQEQSVTLSMSGLQAAFRSMGDDNDVMQAVLRKMQKMQAREAQ
mmetsp:Transcript_15103/g.45270  ORF Transcript_15103/g.45270 Transcript_15103/m.45270 type:complete len:217 (-) Transcript_15103:34-684(-)